PGIIHPCTSRLRPPALAQVPTWQTQTHLHLEGAINPSMRNLHDARLPDAIAEGLAAAGVGADWLHVEITESAVMADPAQAERVLARLAAMGVRISLDDFGTGYTSLGYLGRLPIHEFKIDQS